MVRQIVSAVGHGGGITTVVALSASADLFSSRAASTANPISNARRELTASIRVMELVAAQRHDMGKIGQNVASNAPDSGGVTT